MRRILLYIIILTTGFIFLGRLFYLQIVDDSFAVRSNDNAVKVIYDYPQRGYIYDRDGELMVLWLFPVISNHSTLQNFVKL